MRSTVIVGRESIESPLNASSSVSSSMEDGLCVWSLFEYLLDWAELE